MMMITDELSRGYTVISEAHDVGDEPGSRRVRNLDQPSRNHLFANLISRSSVKSEQLKFSISSLSSPEIATRNL